MLTVPCFGQSIAIIMNCQSK